MAEIILLVFAVCLDSFIACLGFGAAKIKIPVRSALIISLTGACILAVSLFLGDFIGEFFPAHMCSRISALILMVIGVFSLANSAVKHLLKKARGKKTFVFKLSGIQFAINLFLDETVADIDNSKEICVKEAFFLAAALSMDSLVTGFGMGMGLSEPYMAVILSAVTGFLLIILGCKIGAKLSMLGKINLSWLGGAVLIVLALLRF